ncbi:SDR family NAD(P)-dependent oxidoreductase [Gammaproteobacteria bacterium]|nr:SDR family NAD(P)-dependent oxidoreductase [Gammaproteobacteria bacterium]
MIKTDQVVLVTGATGFIGHHLCRDLLSAGFKVRVLTRGKTRLELPSHHHLDSRLGDLLSAETIASLCGGVDLIVHLAGHAHANDADDNYVHKINVLGTKSLLTTALSHGVKKFILISSSLAQAAERDDNRATAYGFSKLEAERLVLHESEKGNIQASVLRPVNVYGEGMRGNISTLISFISKGLIPRLPSLDTQISLLGVEDLIYAIRLVMDSEKANGETYLVTDGNKYSISDIEKAIYSVLGKKIPRWALPQIFLYLIMLSAQIMTKTLGFFKVRSPLTENFGLKTYHNLVSENLFDNNKICEQLEFKPKSTFYDSLPKIVETLNSRV